MVYEVVHVLVVAELVFMTGALFIYLMMGRLVPTGTIVGPYIQPPMINALTEATCTIASVIISNIEEEVETTAPARITRSRANRMNLSATFEGFVPAANPNAWRDRDLT